MRLLRKFVARSPILPLLRSRSRRRNRALLYHRVVDDDVDALTRSLLAGAFSCSEFAAQMQYLARHYRIVALDELLAHRRETGNRVAITFDDGYADNLRNAVPILRALGLPATVFVVAGYVGTDRRFWWDLLARRIVANGPQPLRLEARGQTCTLPFEGSYHRQLHAAGRWLQQLADEDREAVFGAEERHPDDRVLTGTELTQLAANDVAVEAHTMSHPRLVGMPRAEVERELRDGKATLERLLGHPVRYFAYPFGERDDFDLAARQAVQAAGFAAAFSTVRGAIGADDDLFALPRVPANPDLDRCKLRLLRY